MLFVRSNGRGAVLAAVVAIIAILSAVKTGTKTWDDSVLRDLARSYRQRVLLPQGEKFVTTDTTTDTGENATFSAPLDGIVILVTGSTSGIGRSLVRWAFKEGATVLAMGRSKTKLDKQQDELLSEDAQEFGLLECSSSIESNKSKFTGGESGDKESSLARRFFPIVADMSDLTSVSNAVDAIRSALSPTMIRRIDIVVCNAGIWASSDAASTISTEQGHDLTFGVNYLSHFLLTEKLMRTRIVGGGPNPDETAHDEDQYLLSPMTSRVVQVSSSFNIGVDGTALSVVAKEKCDALNYDEDAKKLKIERDGNAEAMKHISYSPRASRVPDACTSGEEGSILHHLQFYFLNQRSYANSKLAQLLHARMSNRNYFSYLGNEGNRFDLGSAPKNRVYVPFVSACPGWVGTHILRSKIEDESWRQRLFLAFAYDVDGFGLSSILKAMFDPLLLDLTNESIEVAKLISSIENVDYYPNSCGFLAWSIYASDRTLVLLESTSTIFFGSNNYINEISKYTRDIVCTLGCGIMLGIQHIFTTSDTSVNNRHTGEISQKSFRRQSSTASYNRTLQQDLYEWSLEAVADYL